MKNKINISNPDSTFGRIKSRYSNICSLSLVIFFIVITAPFFFTGCDDKGPNNVDEEPEQLDPTAEYSFDGPVFDISATGNGTILVADMGVVKEIDANGVNEITDLPLIDGPGAFGEPAITFINGLLPVSDGSFYASRSSLDLSVGSACYFLMETIQN